MKLVKYLAIGTAIAVAAALGICYAVWSFHSLHRIIWFVISVVLCLEVWQYLANPDYTCVEKDGKTYTKKISKTEQVCAVAGILIASGICGSLIWAIGYGVAVIFDLHPDFWEMHLLYGTLTIGSVILAFIAVFRAWYYCNDFYHNRYDTRNYTKKFVIWTVVIICSLAVAGVILYYLFPLALAN